MKNQNYMIVTIAAIGLGLIGLIIGLLPKRQVVQMPAPEAANLAPPQLPSVEIKTATSLPGAGNSRPAQGVGVYPSRGFGAGQSGASTPQSVPPPRPNKPTVTPSAGG